MVGSNIFNLMVVCGACAVFTPLAIQKETLKREFPFSMLCAVVLLVTGYLGMALDQKDGAALLALFVFYLLWMVFMALRARGSSSKEEEYEILPVWKCLIFIVGGAVAIKIGGDLVDRKSVV